MKRNTKTIVAGIVALAMSHAAMAKDIKVAVVGAMSGPVAQWGDMEFNGARQAIKDINASGGIKGDKLVAVEYDDACDPKQAVAVANIVFFDGITAGEKDFSALLARLQKENIDFVYYGGYYPEMGQMLRQARSVGLKTVFMGPEGVGNASLSNIAGAAAEGMLVTMPKRYDQDPANSAIVNALKAEKKDPSGPYVWITYAAVQSLAQAMDRTGSQQPLDLINDLKAHGAKTVIGPLTWDEKGDLKGFEFGVFQWHADGSSSAAK